MVIAGVCNYFSVHDMMGVDFYNNFVLFQTGMKALRVLLSIVLISYIDSESYHLKLDWCIESLPYSKPIVQVKICPQAINLHNFHISIGLFSVWCLAKGVDGSAVNIVSEGVDCRFCELPVNPISNISFATIRTFNHLGVLIHSFDIHDITDTSTMCHKGNHRLLRYSFRPQLYYSVIINNVELPLILQHNELAIEAIDRFVMQHNVDSTHVRNFLASDLRDAVKARHDARARLQDRIVRMQRENRDPIRIVIGATAHEVSNQTNVFGDWIPFTVNELDVLSREDFVFYFGQTNSIDAIVAEHVFEHLSLGDAVWAFQLCREFLKDDGGYLRIAVPDWFSYMPQELAYKTIADIKHQHHTQLNVHSLTHLLKTFSGFAKVVPREFSLDDGSFWYRPLNPLRGKIRRSLCFSSLSRPPSLIVDAFKTNTPTKTKTNLCFVDSSFNDKCDRESENCEQMVGNAAYPQQKCGCQGLSLFSPREDDDESIEATRVLTGYNSHFDSAHRERLCNLDEVYLQGVDYLRCGQLVAAQWTLQVALDMSLVLLEKSQRRRVLVEERVDGSGGRSASTASVDESAEEQGGGEGVINTEKIRKMLRCTEEIIQKFELFTTPK